MSFFFKKKMPGKCCGKTTSIYTVAHRNCIYVSAFNTHENLALVHVQRNQVLEKLISPNTTEFYGRKNLKSDFLTVNSVTFPQLPVEMKNLQKKKRRKKVLFI